MTPGVVYTPRELTAPMVRRALAPLRGAVRVCDPAVGEGAFLLEVIDYLAARERETPRRIAETCVFGADIDAAAVERARQAIARSTGASMAVLREHLVVADALQLAWPWRFDAVVGNPPYIRQELFAAAKPALATYEVYDGVADLYVYFVELAHRLLAPGGRWCFVMPNKWMTAAYGRPLRAFLHARASVEGLVDLAGSELFGVDAFPCVVWGTAGGLATTIAAHRTHDAGGIETDGAPHERARWGAEPWHVDDPDERALIDRLEREFPRLGELAGTPMRGLVTGCNRAFVVDRDTRDALIRDDPRAAAWIRPLLRGRDVVAGTPGKHVIVVDHGTVEADLPRSIARHLAKYRADLEPGTGRKPGSYAWYELQDPVGPLAKSRAPRIFYQDIQTRPACWFDPTGEVVHDTTVWALPSSDPAILAVLGSSLYGWYAKRRFPPALNGAVRPKAAYMRALPIARAHDSSDDAVFDAYRLTRRERALLRAR